MVGEVAQRPAPRRQGQGWWEWVVVAVVAAGVWRAWGEGEGERQAVVVGEAAPRQQLAGAAEPTLGMAGDPAQTSLAVLLSGWMQALLPGLTGLLLLLLELLLLLLLMLLLM